MVTADIVAIIDRGPPTPIAITFVSMDIVGGWGWGRMFLLHLVAHRITLNPGQVHL
jgi:hypothetical protein